MIYHSQLSLIQQIVDLKAGEFRIEREEFTSALKKLIPHLIATESNDEAVELACLAIYLTALTDDFTKGSEFLIEFVEKETNFDNLISVSSLKSILAQKLRIQNSTIIAEPLLLINQLSGGSPFGSFDRISVRYLMQVCASLQIQIPESISDQQTRLSYVLDGLATDLLAPFQVIQRLYNQLIVGRELKASEADDTSKIIYGIQAIWYLIEQCGVSRTGVIQCDAMQEFHLSCSALFMLAMAGFEKQLELDEKCTKILNEMTAEISAYLWNISHLKHPIHATAFNSSDLTDERLLQILSLAEHFLTLTLYTINAWLGDGKSILKIDPPKNLPKIPESEPGFPEAADSFDRLVKPLYRDLQSYRPPGRRDDILSKLLCCAVD